MHLKILIGVLTLKVALSKPQSADIFGKDAPDLLPKDPTSGVFNTFIIHPSTGQSASSSAQEITRPSLTTIFQLFRPTISLTNPSLLHLNTNPMVQSPGTATTDNRLQQTNVPQTVNAPEATPPRTGIPAVTETAPSSPSVADTSVQTNPSVPDTSVQTNPSVPDTSVQTNPSVPDASPQTNPSVSVAPEQTSAQPEPSSSSSPASVSTEGSRTTKDADEDYYSYNYKDDDDE